MKAAALLVLVFASVALADLRFYIAEGNNIRVAAPNTYRFCVAVNEYPNGPYKAYGQFVFDQTTSASIDWDFDGVADAHLDKQSPVHTLDLLADVKVSNFNQKRFETIGAFCGDVKSSHKLIKVIFNAQAVDGGSLTKVDGASACAKVFHMPEVEPKKPSPQPLAVRPQFIFLGVLAAVFACFVFIALLRCCCAAIFRRRCQQGQCCKKPASEAPSASAPAAVDSQEMQTYVYSEPTTPYPAGAYILVPQTQAAPTMAPQFVQVAYPGQQPIYF